MNTDSLRRLADRAEGIEGRRADRLTELHGRIRQARRRRAAMSAATAAAAVAVVVVGMTLASSNDRTQPPVTPNTPRPTPTGVLEAPRGQVTVRPEIGPDDIRGWDLRGSRTNSQPSLAGATDLSLTVETGGLYAFQSHAVTFCNGDPDTWWILTMDLGGVDGGRNPDGSMQDGSRALFGACSQDDPSDLPGATGNIEPLTRNYLEQPMAYPLRMFVTGALSPAAQACFSRTADTDACLSAHALTPLDDTDATFGFGVYEHKAAPVVIDVLRGARFQALAMADGVEYLVDRAVVSAPGARRLVVRMPASERSRIVAVRPSETAAFEDCAASLGHRKPTSAKQEQAQLEEFDRRCITELELQVDGQRPPSGEHDFIFGDQQVVLPPGDARTVTVEVTRNDPRNVRYALVIWEERS